MANSAPPIGSAPSPSTSSRLFGAPLADEPEMSWQSRRYLMHATLFCGLTGNALLILSVATRKTFTVLTIPTVVIVVIAYAVYLFTRLSKRRHNRWAPGAFFLATLLFFVSLCADVDKAPIFPVVSTSTFLILTTTEMVAPFSIGLAVLQLCWTVYLMLEKYVTKVGFLELGIAPPITKVTNLGLHIGFGVVVALASLVIVYNYLRKVLEQERQLENTVSVAHAISTAIAQYDTAGAMAALEDHGEYIDPDLQSAFVDIVKNLGEYRAFLPPALLSKHRALGQLIRMQSFSQQPSSQADSPSDVLSDFNSAIDSENPSPRMSSTEFPSQTTPTDARRNSTALFEDLRPGSVSLASDASFNLPGGNSVSGLFVADVQQSSTHSARSETPNTRASRLGRGTRTATHAPVSSFQNPFHRFPQAVVGFVEFSRVTLMDQAEAGPALSAGFATLARLCREHDATLQGCTGDTALLTWGVDRERPSDVAEAVCRFAIALRSAFAQSADRTPSMALAGAPCDVSCAISSGLALCGAVGHDTAKHFSVLGPCSPGQAPGAALLLQLEGAKFHNAITVSPDLAELAHGLFHVRMIDIVGSASTSTSTAIRCAGLGKSMMNANQEGAITIRLCEVVAPVLTVSASGDDLEATEWMYNLQHQAASSSPFGVCDVMNSAVEKLAMGHYDEAAAVLDTLSNQQRLDPRVATLERSAAAWQSSQSRQQYSSPTSEASSSTSPSGMSYCRKFFN